MNVYVRVFTIYSYNIAAYIILKTEFWISSVLIFLILFTHYLWWWIEILIYQTLIFFSSLITKEIDSGMSSLNFTYQATIPTTITRTTSNNAATTTTGVIQYFLDVGVTVDSIAKCSEYTINENRVIKRSNSEFSYLQRRSIML